MQFSRFSESDSIPKLKRWSFYSHFLSIAIFLNYAEEQNTKSFPLNNFFIRKYLGLVELIASWSYRGRGSIQGATSYFQEATSFNMGMENCSVWKTVSR